MIYSYNVEILIYFKRYYIIYDSTIIPEPQTYEQLKLVGFTWSKEEHNWSENEITLLLETIKDLYKKPSQAHTKDLYYYISHYVFEKQITAKQIKVKVKVLLNDYM